MIVTHEDLDLSTLNAMFETADPQKVVEWTVAEFGALNVVMSSSFGADSAVLLHMATRVVPDLKVIFVNTGYLFPETHAHMEARRQRLNLNVWTFRTRNDPIAYLHRAGAENPAWRKDIDRCCVPRPGSAVSVGDSPQAAKTDSSSNFPTDSAAMPFHRC
jgi:3'-phosphoadenosine 5'-phosphosulfate sulfotransferase (PAPS reductase)/FAD synthetase